MLRQRNYLKMALYTDEKNFKAKACYSKCGFEVTETFIEEMANGKNVARCKMEISFNAIWKTPINSSLSNWTQNRIPKIRLPTGRTMRKVGGLFYPQNPKKEVKDHPWNGMSGGWCRLSSRVLFVTFRGDESSPLHLVPCIGWYHSTTRVVIPTWWAACRPYGHTGRWYRSPTQVISWAFPERHTGRSLRFRWLVYSFPNVFQKRKRPLPITVNCKLST